MVPPRIMLLCILEKIDICMIVHIGEVVHSKMVKRFLRFSYNAGLQTNVRCGKILDRSARTQSVEQSVGFYPWKLKITAAGSAEERSMG